MMFTLQEHFLQLNAMPPIKISALSETWVDCVMNVENVHCVHQSSKKIKHCMTLLHQQSSSGQKIPKEVFSTVMESWQKML